MSDDFSHKFLKNPSDFANQFVRNNRSPGNNQEREEEEEETPIADYSHKKNSLKTNWTSFESDIAEKHQNRNIVSIPTHIDYIEVKFHKVFNKDLMGKFRRNYGLSPVIFSDFNFTVLFAITNSEAFDSFENHIIDFFELSNEEDPHGKPYSLLLLIESFKFLRTQDIITSVSNDSVVELKLIDSAEIATSYITIRENLISFFTNNNVKTNIESTSSTIELEGVNTTICEEIVNNFDIISSVQSIRSRAVKPSVYGTVIRDFNFTLNNDESAPMVGVIDTGIAMNSPLRDCIINKDYDLVNPNDPLSIHDSAGHGTAVAGLIVFGHEFYDELTTEFISKANVVPIKVLEGEEGSFSIIELVKVIRHANEAHQIRLFNLSVNTQFYKQYNENISSYAYELDKLAFQLDVLITISTGNHDFDEIENMQATTNELHNYPNHFYNPYKYTPEHACEVMNINPPSESYNNITVGAIADNFNGNSHLTLDKNFPAYYTKKYFLDYSKKINGALPYQSIISNYLFKPDLVDFGGDAINSESGIEVLSTSIGSPFENRAGTSLAAPLVTSIEAEILKAYPSINVQSVKALLINSAELPYNKNFLNALIDDLKEQGAREFFNKSLTQLDNSEKLRLGKIFHRDRLSNYLGGFGKVNREVCLKNDANSATYVIEQSIKVNQHKVMVLNLPDYLQGLSSVDGKQILKITVTLCYKFEPVFNNQLCYCPLHISFGLFSPMSNDLSELSKYVSMTGKELGALGLKRDFKSGIKWSEDFYPPNVKPFNNSQKINLNIRKCDLEVLNNKITIAVRSTNKDGIEPVQLNRLLSDEHPFSMVVRIDEMKIDGANSNNLYNAIHAINIVENIIELDSDLEAELD